MADYHIEVPNGTQEVIITRLIHAPREVVFKALTNPMLVPKWWGPERFTTIVHKMSVMPGGTWRYVQTDKEGKEFAFHGVYHDVAIPERLVYTSEFEGMPGHVTLYTETLKEENGETIITTLAVFQSVEDHDQLLQWGMEEGTSEMTRRLNALLANEGVQER